MRVAKTNEQGTVTDMNSVQGADAGEVGDFLARRLHDERWRACQLTLLAGGFSNITYLISAAPGELVLRRPPLGHVLPTAHDMGREFRVMRALEKSPVPVPRTILTEPADGPLGFSCAITERVVGHVCRGSFPMGFADDPATRRGVGEALVDALVDLHLVDPEAVGLGDFGRPEGFMERQLRRWSKQWEGSTSGVSPAWESLRDRLAEDVPDNPITGIVHGDYRLDNVILHPSEPGRVQAILDWEMSTLGDPSADVGALLAVWAEPDDDELQIAARVVPAITDLPGFPSRDDLLERYARKAGRDVSRVDWYIAFAYFKLAVICQGIATRHAQGATVGDGFDDAARFVEPLIRAGSEALR